jgi:iron(III) transport system ATP-binding protein
MSSLVVTGVTKSFGRVVALRGVDLTVPSGTLTAVLGPSGCGKTTLLRCVAGFEHVDAGEIRLDGSLVAARATHVPPQHRRVAVVPQEGALFPHLSFAGNVG